MRRHRVPTPSSKLPRSQSTHKRPLGPKGEQPPSGSFRSKRTTTRSNRKRAVACLVPPQFCIRQVSSRREGSTPRCVNDVPLPSIRWRCLLRLLERLSWRNREGTLSRPLSIRRRSRVFESIAHVLGPAQTINRAGIGPRRSSRTHGGGIYFETRWTIANHHEAKGQPHKQSAKLLPSTASNGA